MNKIYYPELIKFIQEENLNIKEDKLRKGTKILDLTEYDLVINGLVHYNLQVLQDITQLKNAVLKYQMGTGFEMMLLNILLQAKGILADLDVNSCIKTRTGYDNERIFSLSVEDNQEEIRYYTISVSTARNLVTTEDAPESYKLALDYIKPKFDALANIHL